MSRAVLSDLSLQAALLLVTSQVVNSALPLAIALGDATTRYFLTTSGDGDIESITAGTAGRLVLFQSVATGAKRFRHQFGGAGGTKFICPRALDFYVSDRENVLLLCDGGTGWLVMPLGGGSAMAPRTVKGRQTDAATGQEVDLTGDELSENLRRNTIQTLSGVSGDLNVTLNADTTVLLIRTTADARLLSLSAGTGGGREILVEHDRLSGSGMLTLAHNNGAGTLFKLFLRKAVDAVLDHAESATLRDRASFWRMNDGPASVMAAGTVRGNPISAAGAAMPVDLTGTQVGQLIREGLLEVFTLTAGVQTLTLQKTTTLVYIHATGDVIFDQIIHGASNTGASFLLVRDTGTGRVLVRDGNANTNSIWAPGATDWHLSSVNDAALMKHNGFRWYVAGRQLPLMTAGTVMGNPIDAAGVAVPAELTGAQLGSLLRRYWYKTHTTPTGSITGYVLTEKEIQIHFNVAVATTVHSFTISAGKTIEIALENTSLPVTLPNESVLGTLGLVRTSDALDLTLYGGDGATITFLNNRYRVMGVSRNIRPDALAPLAANKAVRYTYHVPYVAGSAGARDVLLTPGETFNQRIVRVSSMLNVSQAASSGQLRSASAGGGSPLSFAVATTATGTTTDESSRLTPNDVVAGTPIYWALTDGRVAGDIFVDCLRY